VDATRFRSLYIAEDAADGCACYVPEPYVDALADAISLEDEPMPNWHCDCGTLNNGIEFACIYCGREREDT